MNGKVCILFCFILLTNCVSEKKSSNYQKLVNFCNENELNNIEKYHSVIVINEEGNCINCNNSFAKFQSKFLDQEDFLFIVSGYGTKVDISGYVDKSSENLILDPKNKVGDLGLVSSCAFIEIVNSDSLKITPVNLSNVERFSSDGFFEGHKFEMQSPQ